MLNMVAEMGRLVATPELRKTKSGVPVTSFTLAVDRSYVKAGEDRKADFIDFVAWRSTAEFICKHFRKGQMMAVKGSIQTRIYEGGDGKKHKVMEVVAEEVDFAGSKRVANNDTAAQEPNSADESNAAMDEEYTQGDFAVIPDVDDGQLPF